MLNKMTVWTVLKRFKKQIHFINLIKRCLGKWANIWDRRTQEGRGLDRSVWRSERSCLVWNEKACCPSMGLYTAEVKQKRQVFKPAALYLFLSTCCQSPQRLHNNLIFMPFSFHLDGDQLLHSAPIRCPYLEGLQGCYLRMLGAVLRACVMELCVWVCLWSCPEVSSLQAEWTEPVDHCLWFSAVWRFSTVSSLTSCLITLETGQKPTWHVLSVTLVLS